MKTVKGSQNNGIMEAWRFYLASLKSPKFAWHHHQTLDTYTVDTVFDRRHQPWYMNGERSNEAWVQNGT